MRNLAYACQIGSLLGALMTWSSTALAQVPDFWEGQSLTSVHQQLINQGWSVSNEALSAEPLNPQQQRIKVRLPSLITCSGTGQGLCAYGYSRHGRNLRLVAQPDGALLRWFPQP